MTTTAQTEFERQLRAPRCGLCDGCRALLWTSLRAAAKGSHPTDDEARKAECVGSPKSPSPILHTTPPIPRPIERAAP